MLDDVARHDLGHALRAVYADLIAAPVPERFVTLLAALERGEAGPGPDGTEEASR